MIQKQTDSLKKYTILLTKGVVRGGDEGHLTLSSFSAASETMVRRPK